MELLANEEYFDGAPAIPHLIFSVCSDMDAAVIALESGELDFLAELDNLDIKIFRFEKHDEGYEELNEQEKAEEKTNILNALNFARKVIATQECDFLLLDEILALPDYGITTAEAIGDILKMKDESMHILLTGRTLPDSLRKYADSITTLTTEIV